MGMKEFFKDSFDKFKESNKPENIKRKLKQQIEIESLRAKKDKLMNKRREEKYSKGWSVGIK